MSHRGGLRERLARLRGSTVTDDLSDYRGPLADIGRLEPELRALGDLDLTARAQALRAEARGGRSLDEIQVRAYALVREVARRVLGMRPFDEQVVAALALHRGAVVEMQTGEGKTLAAVMPVYLNALTGRGLHVLTFNDYLARRDAEWMGPIYRALDLSVDWIDGGRARAARRPPCTPRRTLRTAHGARLCQPLEPLAAA